jgi:hypothetical protein
VIARRVKLLSVYRVFVSYSDSACWQANKAQEAGSMQPIVTKKPTTSTITCTSTWTLTWSCTCSSCCSCSRIWVSQPRVPRAGHSRSAAPTDFDYAVLRSLPSTSGY